MNPTSNYPVLRFFKVTLKQESRLWFDQVINFQSFRHLNNELLEFYCNVGENQCVIYIQDLAAKKLVWQKSSGLSDVFIHRQRQGCESVLFVLRILGRVKFFITTNACGR